MLHKRDMNTKPRLRQHAIHEARWAGPGRATAPGVLNPACPQGRHVTAHGPGWLISKWELWDLPRAECSAHILSSISCQEEEHEPHFTNGESEARSGG